MRPGIPFLGRFRWRAWPSWVKVGIGRSGRPLGRAGDGTAKNKRLQNRIVEDKMKRLLMITAICGLAGGWSAQAAEGKENWSKHCAKCHGEDGKGDTKMGKKAGAKDLTDAKVQEAKTDDQWFKSIKEGVKEGDKTRMKAYAEEGLSDDEIKALVAYARSFKK